MKHTDPRTSRLLAPRINAKRPLRTLVEGGAAVALAASAILAQAALPPSVPRQADANEIAPSETVVQEEALAETLDVDTNGEQPNIPPDDSPIYEAEPSVGDEGPQDPASPNEATDGDGAASPDGDAPFDETDPVEDGPSGPDATLALATGVPMAQGASAHPLDALLQTVALHQQEGSSVRVVATNADTGSVIYFDAS